MPRPNRNTEQEFLKPEEVFTPGKLPIGPNHIYASRGQPQDAFIRAIRTASVPLLYGEYGVGKTTLARHVFKTLERTGNLVNIESAAKKSFSDVIRRCLESFGYSVKTKTTMGSRHQSGLESSANASIGAFSWIHALVATKRASSEEEVTQAEHQILVSSPTDSKVIELCEANSVVLLIDELHHASPDFCEDLTIFIKTYANANCHRFKIALLGTSSDASRLVASDVGIDRLIQEIHLPQLTSSEAALIVDQGMSRLNVAITSEAKRRLVYVSVGSPSILQYIALETAELVYFSGLKEVSLDDVNSALTRFVRTKISRLNRTYLGAIESTGRIHYRKKILTALANIEDEYVNMESLRAQIENDFGRATSTSSLSGPLKSLKSAKCGCVLVDVQRPDGTGRLRNLTTFRDPALKAFIRLQRILEIETQLERRRREA